MTTMYMNCGSSDKNHCGTTLNAPCASLVSGSQGNSFSKNCQHISVAYIYGCWIVCDDFKWRNAGTHSFPLYILLNEIYQLTPALAANTRVTLELFTSPEILLNTPDKYKIQRILDGLRRIDTHSK